MDLDMSNEDPVYWHKRLRFLVIPVLLIGVNSFVTDTLLLFLAYMVLVAFLVLLLVFRNRILSWICMIAGFGVLGVEILTFLFLFVTPQEHGVLRGILMLVKLMFLAVLDVELYRYYRTQQLQANGQRLNA